MVLTKKGKKMSEQEKQTLTFENKTYEVDSLTDEQKKLVNGQKFKQSRPLKSKPPAPQQNKLT